jgi:cytochrome c551/c552
LKTARHTGLCICLLFVASLAAAPADRDDQDDALEPGLVAVYRSLSAEGAATLTCIDAKPAFMLGDSSPHPRLPPGPFEVTWAGTLDQTTADAIRFGAFMGGSVTVTLNGITVLEGHGDSAASWVEAPARHWPIGRYPLHIVYRSSPGAPARFQLWWEGTLFAREPVPAWRLKHSMAGLPQALAKDELAGRGRRAAGQLGCARCHASAFPAVDDPPPGPRLTDLGRRFSRAWLLEWLAEPAQVRADARMPAVFSADRQGFVERWLVTEHLAAATNTHKDLPSAPEGKEPVGRKAFLSLGCVACHPIPDKLHADKPLPGQHPLDGLADRMPAADLAAHIEEPHKRYPDGRMPRIPVPPQTARDIAVFLLAQSAPAHQPVLVEAPSRPEIEAVAKRLGVAGAAAAGQALIREKRCAHCHPGLEVTKPEAIPIRNAPAAGCLSGTAGPRFSLAPPVRSALTAYLAVSAQERHPSPFETRRQMLSRAGCLQCHSRDAETLAPLEVIGSRITDKDLSQVAGQRTPKLTNVLAKYQRSYVLKAIRDGVQGTRAAGFTYRMPAFGDHAEPILQALAEGDGDLVTDIEPPITRIADPELPAQGPNLVGSAGYSCVSCHTWKGKNLSAPEPGAAGPELTTVTTRIRRDYFDRWLEDPSRVQPRTPMPRIFHKGQLALLTTVLGGDPQRQKDALWSYLALGVQAPEPVALPATPFPPPAAGAPPLVAQIPIHMPDRSIVESLLVLFGSHDAFVYDVGSASFRQHLTSARLLRVPKGRRSFALEGTPAGPVFSSAPYLQLAGLEGGENPSALTFVGYDHLRDGVRIRTRAGFKAGMVEIAETLRLDPSGTRQLLRELRFAGVPANRAMAVRTHSADPAAVRVRNVEGVTSTTVNGDGVVVRFVPDASARAAATIVYPLPPAAAPAPLKEIVPAAGGPTVFPGTIAGASEQPGYRAVAYPRFKTIYGQDLVMPGALAVDPRSGRLYIASMKMGEVFVLNDPHGDAKDARFDNYGAGLFQDAYGMTHDGEALYLLHRRNLTRIRDLDGDGVADTFDRVAALHHTATENVDNTYGLLRDAQGRFIFTYAVNTPQKQPGWGSVLRLTPGEPVRLEELAFGLRRAYGWCLGPANEIFFTDNQGEWVATNRLCHVDYGKTFGYPNPGQEHHRRKPAGKTAVWIPYGWALSTNGLVYDTTGGKFGPFAGQFFTAGWTDRGGIIRIQVEQVNGVYQGACFPFWGPGMLGPLVLAFDLKGRLFVGSITEGSCGAHPDRGGLFRIDFTGQTPFEIQSIHARTHGFRVVFTAPADPRTAREPASYSLEHYRYIHTAEYGSPELDRTRLAVTDIQLSADGRTAELTTAPLVKDRVYMIHADGVRSMKGEALVHPVGAYTLNEIPAGE